jgi:isopentenyl-diphosphate delta-isomerase
LKKEETSSRKKDHIELALEAQISSSQTDDRFYYEPIMSGHPRSHPAPTQFFGKALSYPIWISSMTGGTKEAFKINTNLARACGEFKLGMGLGSCRIILDDDHYLNDFQFRKLVGDQPFFANLGIAQVEKLVWAKQVDKIKKLIDKIDADGLIVHINPVQEWLQPEGDHIEHSPVETLERLLNKFDFPVIAKEVGQGMGPESLKQLFSLPLGAIEFAAHGGTNFAKLELLRSNDMHQNNFNDLAFIGHTAEEMVHFSNQIINDLGKKVSCNQVIISGGIKSFLDGYYLIHKLNSHALYGQASAFLKYAASSYEELAAYTSSQIKGYQLASHFLKVK